MQTEYGYLGTCGRAVPYATLGKGQRKLLFLPGALWHTDLPSIVPNSKRLVEALAAGQRVLVLSSAGTRTSDPPYEPSFRGHVNDARLALEFLGRGEVGVVAVADAAAVGIALAAMTPARVRRLLLVAPIGVAPQPSDGWGKEWASFVAAMEQAVEVWGSGSLATALSDGAASSAEWARVWGLVERMCLSPAEARAFWSEVQTRDVRCELSHVRARTLVLQPSNDAVPSGLARAIASEIPNADLVELPGMSRKVDKRFVEVIARIAREFLESRPTRNETDLTRSPSATEA